MTRNLMIGMDGCSIHWQRGYHNVHKHVGKNGINILSGLRCHLAIASVLLALLLCGCTDRYDPLRLQGETMGTTWSVVTTESRTSADLQSSVSAELARINDVMSTWQRDSEISMLNRAVGDRVVPVSPELRELLMRAGEIHTKSNGAYDVTVGALVDLWGFGPTQKTSPRPTDRLAVADIEDVMAQVGFHRLRFTGEGVLKPDGLLIDLSSIAKGYAVDRIAELLEAEGYEHYMVEIGGEIRTRGFNPSGVAWRIGIERPESGHRIPFTSLPVRDMAVATSGDYRNYFEEDGQRYSHIIDPRTGYPIAHRLVSATVLHPSAAMADGFATAITVMGSEEGLAMAERERLPVLLIIRQNDVFEAVSSTALQRLVRNTDG